MAREVKPHQYSPSLAWEDAGDCTICGQAETSPIHEVPIAPIPFETTITVVYYADTVQEAHKLAQELGEGIFEREFTEQVEVERPRRLDIA